MKPLKYAFCLFLLVAMDAVAQESGFSSEVAAYLESNSTLDQYNYAYDQLLKMLGDQHPKSDSNTKGWAFLEENRVKALADIKALLIPIYEQHFDNEDIQRMTAFYSSETGKQLMNDRSQMTEMQKENLNTFYNSPVGQKIIAKQPILTREIAEISERWSRDLYETAVSLLKN